MSTLRFFGSQPEPEKVIKIAFDVANARQRGEAAYDEYGNPEKIIAVWYGGMFSGVIGAAVGSEMVRAGLVNVPDAHLFISVGGMNAVSYCLNYLDEAIKTYITIAKELHPWRWVPFKLPSLALDALNRHVQLSEEQIRAIQPELCGLVVDQNKQPKVLRIKGTSSPWMALKAGMSLPVYTSAIEIAGERYSDCAWTDVRYTVRRFIWEREPTGVVFVLNRPSQFEEVRSIMEGIPRRGLVTKLWGDKGLGITCTQGIPYCGIMPTINVSPTTTDVDALEQAADHARRGTRLIIEKVRNKYEKSGI